MQIRTLGKIAVLCFGATLPFMAGAQAHAAQFSPSSQHEGVASQDVDPAAQNAEGIVRNNDDDNGSAAVQATVEIGETMLKLGVFLASGNDY